MVTHHASAGGLGFSLKWDMGWMHDALAYFAVDALPPALRAIPLEYFAGAFDWLAGRPGVRDDGVGLVGTSLLGVKQYIQVEGKSATGSLCSPAASCSIRRRPKSS